MTIRLRSLALIATFVALASPTAAQPTLSHSPAPICWGSADAAGNCVVRLHIAGNVIIEGGTIITQAPDLRPLIHRVREGYGATMTKPELGEALVRIAAEAGPDWGVLLKPGGTNCPSAVGLISCDILVYIPTQQEYDVFGSIDDESGNPGPAHVDFSPVSDRDTGLPVKCGTPGKSGCDMSRVRSVAEGTTTRPKPQPQPRPDVVDHVDPSNITHEDLADDLLELARMVADLKSHVQELRARVELAAAESTNAATRSLTIIELLKGRQVGGLESLPPYKGTTRDVFGRRIEIVSHPCPSCR